MGGGSGEVEDAEEALSSPDTCRLGSRKPEEPGLELQSGECSPLWTVLL